MRAIDYTSNTLDSRDLAERIEELQGLKRALEEAKQELAKFDPERQDIAPDDEAWYETKDELETAVSDAEDEFGEEEKAELAELEAAAEEVCEWSYGATLVSDSYFEDYARELAEDCCPSREVAKALEQWPYRCIDWEKAAEELKQDYSTVTLQGEDFYFRNC